jgi:hypothetical protein
MNEISPTPLLSEPLDLLEEARRSLAASWRAATRARDEVLQIPAQCGRQPRHSYILNTSHPGDRFDPFDPDPLGALREAYAWISQPVVATPDRFTYDAFRYDALTEMLRRAIRNAEAAP